MSWMDQVGDILNQYKGAPDPNATNVPGDFAKVAHQAPSSVISGGLSQAFRSPNTPPFGQMVSQLFGQSDPSQRAGILNHLIAAAGPALSAGTLGSLLSSVTGSQGTVSPQQAQQVPPDAVRELATQAEKRDPTIVDKAGQFYAQHPQLVQGLGAAALAIIMSHASQRR